MNRFFCILQSTLISITIAWACCAAIPAVHAQSTSQLDKHSRKIEKELARFSPGDYLDFEFRDSSESYGSLGQLTDASFEFTNTDTNKMESHSYAEVSNVKKAKEYIGRDSERRHHIRLIPVIISAAAAATGLALYETFR